MKLSKIFGAKKPIIGAIHFLPLIGYKDFTSLKHVLEAAIKDLRSFEKGGVSAVIIENNYDLPHKIYVEPETVAAMTLLGLEISKRTKLPVGVSVLWNDYRSALSIAKVINAKFVRIPAYVDDVMTSFGRVNGVAKKALDYRKKLKAENVLIFADVQVKHAKMIKRSKPLVQSIKQAKKNLADAVIITGKWTGDSPQIETIRKAKKASGSFPVLVGSGVNENNVTDILTFSDGVIVSTSLKAGQKLSPKINRNLKDSSNRINTSAVKKIVKRAYGK